MTRYLQIALLAGAALLTLGSEITVAAESDQAQTIVDKADQIRFPRESFQVDVLITSTAPDREPEQRKYRILSKDNDNTLVVTLEPAADKGQVLLMRGRDVWIYMTKLAPPIPCA